MRIVSCELLMKFTCEELRVSLPGLGLVHVTSTVGLLTKFAPLIVRVWALSFGSAVIGLGVTLLIEGAGTGAFTTKPATFEGWPTGLVTFPVQWSKVLST